VGWVHRRGRSVEVARSGCPVGGGGAVSRCQLAVRGELGIGNWFGGLVSALHGFAWAARGLGVVLPYGLGRWSVQAARVAGGCGGLAGAAWGGWGVGAAGRLGGRAWRFLRLRVVHWRRGWRRGPRCGRRTSVSGWTTAGVLGVRGRVGRSNEGGARPASGESRAIERARLAAGKLGGVHAGVRGGPLGRDSGDPVPGGWSALESRLLTWSTCSGDTGRGFGGDGVVGVWCLGGWGGCGGRVLGVVWVVGRCGGSGPRGEVWA